MSTDQDAELDLLRETLEGFQHLDSCATHSCATHSFATYVSRAILDGVEHLHSCMTHSFVTQV